MNWDSGPRSTKSPAATNESQSRPASVSSDDAKSEIDSGRSVAEIKLYLIDFVEKRIDGKLNQDLGAAKTALASEVTTIKTTVGYSAKFATVVLSLLTLGLSILGIKTCSDVESLVQKTAEGQVKAQLEKTDGPKLLQERIQVLAQHALIDRYSIGAARSQGRLLSREDPGVLSAHEVQQLIDLVFDQQSATILVARALQVLSGRAARNFSDRVGRDLVRLLENGNARGGSALDQSRKALVVQALSRMRVPAAAPLIRNSITSDQSIPNDLYTAAVRYVVATSDLGAMPALEKVAAEWNTERQFAAVEALARIKPDNKLVKEWISNSLSRISTAGGFDIRVAAQLFRVASGIVASAPKGFASRSGTEVKERYISAAAIVDALLRTPLRLRVAEKAFQSDLELTLFEAGRETAYYSTSHVLLSNTGFFTQLVNRGSKKVVLEDLKRLLAAISLDSDEYAKIGFLRAEFSDKDAAIVLDKDIKLDGGIGRRGVRIRLRSIGGAQSLMARWVDDDGAFHEGSIRDFVNADTMRFQYVVRLTSAPTIDFAEDEDGE